MYRIIAIVFCAVVVIALGFHLRYKLTKKDAPKEVPTVTPTESSTKAPTETKDEVTPSVVDQVVGAGEWGVSKKYWIQEGEEYLREEYFYDEQGRLTEERTYNLDRSVYWTEYHSYDCNGERMEHWTPDRGGTLDLVQFTDISGTVVYVSGYYGETCQEDFYDDGFIKEFRIYVARKPSEKKLEKVIKWEYDDERKNIRRTYYMDGGDGELEPVGNLRIELDSEGRIARCVDYGHPNGVQSVTEYRYEGNRRIETVTWGTGTDEFVYEGNHLISSRVRMGSGTVWVTERFYPNVNWHLSDCFLYEYLESEIEVAKDGTETPRYKVEFTNDGKPLRQIELETGAVVTEYQYGADGKLSEVLHWSYYLVDPKLTKAAVIKLDQYGNLVECEGLGVCERYEWIRLSDAEQ